MLHEAAYIPGLLLAASCAFATAWLLRDHQLGRTMAVVCANWLAGIAFNVITGSYHGWEFNILLDTSASVAILWRPAGKMQALLGVSYCVQIAMHSGYGAATLFGSPDPGKYYAALTAVAWIQLLLIGGWCFGIWAGDIVRHRLGDRGSSASTSRIGGLA